MARKDELGKDVEGRYRRYIGWKWGNGRPIQHLFRLGRDEQQAKAANYRLEQLWDAVVARWKRQRTEGTTEEPAPVWDDITLAIGQAIAKGQTTCTLYPPPGMENMHPAALATWLAVLQTQFPTIGLKLPDTTQEQGVQGMKRREAILESSRRLTERLLGALGEAARTTVYEALDAYSAYLGEKYKEKPSNRPQQLSITLLKQHTDDFGLNKLDADRIETWLAYWCRRPASKDTAKPGGSTLAFTTCRNVLIVMRQFLRWLSRSPQFDWTLPGGFVFPRCQIVKVAADRVKKRRHFTLDELKTIWQYAKPWERALILLALNCGFSKAEIATLQPSEIVQGMRHTFIKRDRRKTDVYGEWVLWSETLEALDYLKQYQKPDSVYVVLNTAGTPLNKGTRKGNENQVIKNHWDNLFKRIHADHPDFYKLPFKHLRKTGANLIRHMKGGRRLSELASMYLAHGERTDGNDQLLQACTDRPWKKLHRVLLRLRAMLLPMLTSVESPWAYTMNTISPVKRARVKELRAAGKTLKVIAAEVGLHEMTVGKICRQG
ncbi:MAG TPA: hypothetical protein VKA46_28030 [Gemmataceae bacterium]|nr:hypothetical protein [Gemmataceae bacterium]